MSETTIETKPVEKNTDLTVIKTDTKVPENKTTSAAVINQPNQTEKKDAVVANTNPVEKKSETKTGNEKKKQE